MEAGAIIRVSTSKQLQGTSPEKQLEAIRSLAADQGHNVDDQHAWLVAESGGRRERVGFRLALDAADAGDISRVYVFNVDRLGRNLLEMLLFLRDLDDLEVECWAAERRRHLEWNDFMLQIEGAVAGRERQEIVRRTQDGLRRAIRAGKYSGGIIAYGYRLNPETKRLEIDEEEAAVVRLIFEWCVEERLSTVKIAERLNAMGIPTRYQKDGRKVRQKGKRRHTVGIWRAGRVRHMLRNTAYMGHWVYGKRSKSRRDLIEAECPAIVTEETFARAGEVLRSNRLFSPRNSRRKYLLRGLIHCQDCGLTYCGACWKVGPNRSREKTYYICNGRSSWRKLGREKCQSKALNAIELEAVVWEDIKVFVKNPEVAIQQLRAKSKPEGKELREQLTQAEEQIAELHRRERNLLRVAAESEQVDPQALDQVLAEIRQSLASLEAYRGRLKLRHVQGEALKMEMSRVAEHLAQLQDRIDRASFEEKRRAVEVLVKAIDVATVEFGRKKVSQVSITYRFDDLDPTPEWRSDVSIADRKPGPAGTLE